MDTFVWVNTGADVIVDGHDPWTPATQTRQQDADDYACPGARGWEKVILDQWEIRLEGQVEAMGHTFTKQEHVRGSSHEALVTEKNTLLNENDRIVKWGQSSTYIGYEQG